MPILRERAVWRRAKPRHGYQLNEAERQNVRAVLHAMTRRHGSVAALAKQLGICHDAITRANGRHARASAGFALALARAMGVSVESLLAGTAAQACPTCGRA